MLYLVGPNPPSLCPAKKKPGYTVQRKIYCLYNIPHFVLFYVSCSYNTTLVVLTVIFAYRKQDVPLRKKQAS